MTSDGELMCLDKSDFQAILQASVIRRISEDALDTLVLEGERAVVLVDVRLPMESRHDTIPGARNLPLNELRQRARGLEREFLYILCAEGRRSELGAYILSEAGLDALVLDRETMKTGIPRTRSTPRPPRPGDRRRAARLWLGALLLLVAALGRADPPPPM